MIIQQELRSLAVQLSLLRTDCDLWYMQEAAGTPSGASSGVQPSERKRSGSNMLTETHGCC